VYTPATFRLDDSKLIDAIIERHPFATVVAPGPSGLEASPLPLLLDRERREIVGHLARANPLAKLLDAGVDALCIFQGPHAYVSPRWYQEPLNVPTWNYVHVHVTGRATTFDDRDGLVAFLHRLVDRFEDGAKGRWKFDLPEDFVDDLVKAIVGFRVPMQKVEAKLKLSQNREPADAAGALAGLEASADGASREVAAWMRSIGVGLQ
jgi:transcriptional regulator